MEAVNKKPEEVLVFNKAIFFLIKYIGSPIICISLILLEGVFRRVEFRHYYRLPLWEGNIIILPNHRSWWDVILAPHIYFPWWFREFKDDLLDLLRELLSAVHRVLWWVVDERVRVKVGNGENIFSKDVPITAACRHNLRHFPWLIGYIFRVNRQKFGGTAQERAISTRFAQRVLKRGGRIIDFAEGGMLNSVGDEEKIFDIATRQPILRLLEPRFSELVSITGSKVILVIFIGADKVLPRGEFPFPRIWHKVTVGIGEPLVFPVGTSPELIMNVIDKARVDLYYETLKGKP